jgi:hypothetical protein
VQVARTGGQLIRERRLGKEPLSQMEVMISIEIAHKMLAKVLIRYNLNQEIDSLLGP